MSADHDGRPAWRILGGILQEVGQDLFNLNDVQAGRRQSPGDIQFYHVISPGGTSDG